MPNPLDPIWDAHLTARAALKVVRRSVTVAGIGRAKAFSNTRFDGLTDQQCIDHLHAAHQPTPAFGLTLAASFSEYCNRNSMDELADLFVSAVGQTLVAQAGNIRTYRHWLAHGRRWAQPPTVSPRFAYQTLTAFLQACGLA
jgi:hypothetical protein